MDALALPQQQQLSARGRLGALMLPHLDAAYNLARWLLRDATTADDAVREVSLRASRDIASLRGDDARAWLLGIVRSACFSLLERQRRCPEPVEFDDTEFHAAAGAAGDGHADPAARSERNRMKALIDAAIRALSPPLREVIVLRELEGLEYAEIARIANVPIGTVMSRLSRARETMRAALGRVTCGRQHCSVPPG
jgi:RNA polymerase sigma factor (sigma-70 family)